MVKNSSTIRTILFNILVILTIIFIYILFFPKKSYLKEKIDNGLNTENISNQNKDNDLNPEVDSKECLYQYEKKIESTYTNWSEWSEWDINKVEANELTNVEEKTETVLDGTKTITDTREVSINATKSSTAACPEGYTKTGNECTKKTEGNAIKASISYSCPKGYSRTGVFCYKLSEKIDAIKNYYCPKNTGNTEYELSGDTCRTFNIIHSGLQTKDNYSCPQGYRLSNEKCYKTEQYEKEVDNYKEVTYYRYQTREKQEEKIDIKWSTENDEDLLNQEYNMVGKVTCEF